MRQPEGSAGDQLRRRCLVPLLEGSEALRRLALSSGLVGACSSCGELIVDVIGAVTVVSVVVVVVVVVVAIVFVVSRPSDA